MAGNVSVYSVFEIWSRTWYGVLVVRGTRRNTTIQDVGKTLAASRKAASSRELMPEEWVDAHGDHLYRYAFTRLREPEAAEEAVQETFLAAIRGAEQYGGHGTERSWLLGILKRKIIDMVRLRERDERVGMRQEFDPTSLLFDENGQWRSGVIPTVEADNQLELREIWDVVRRCLLSIPRAQADVFVLSVMEELDTERICRELQISRSNLWIRLHRARLGLAKCVSSKWFSESRGAYE